MGVGTPALRPPTAVFTHRALFYDTADELVEALVPFVNDGIAADERVIVVVESSVGARLRDRIASADAFELYDSEAVYTSPVHTLADYFDRVRDGTRDGRRMRVAGEPLWMGRSTTAVAEWTCVEAACNVIFAGVPLTMLCPYRIPRLDSTVVEAARWTHPEIQRRSSITASPEFAPVEHQERVRGSVLAAGVPPFGEIEIRAPDDVSAVATLVEAFSVDGAMSARRRLELCEAVEAVVGTVPSGSGPTRLRIWRGDADLVCEVEFVGSFPSPFAGLLPPSSPTLSGDGVWIAGLQCDLVVVREGGGTTRVRLHVADDPVTIRPGCNGVDRMLGVYALGACDPSEARQVEMHLDVCADCRVETERLRQVVVMLRASFPDHLGH